MTEVKDSIMLKIGNLQIDNLINDEFPVLFGAAKYYDKKLIRKVDEFPWLATALKRDLC